MTVARQRRKRLGTVAVLSVAILATAALGGVVRAATTERIVIDEQTGLAIAGFDPVGYFVDSKPEPGRPDFELNYAGADWRFRNEGNRAAFKANPDVYMPRYGGYDPIGVMRGVAVAGNPELWIVAGQRLYLFYDAAARAAFAAEPGAAIAAAEKRWPQVLHGLTP